MIIKMQKMAIIEEKLKELTDKKYKEFQLKLCPGVDNILGVKKICKRPIKRIHIR